MGAGPGSIGSAAAACYSARKGTRMFAKLTGPTQRPAGYILSTWFADCTWVDTASEATELSDDQAKQLVAERKILAFAL